MATTSSISSTSSQLETLVTQYKTVLTAQYLTPLNNKKTTLQARLNALATLKTKLESLNTAATALTGASAVTKFKVYTVESSNSSVATATATSSATPGAYNLFVSSLAKADTVLSSRLTSADTSIVTAEFTPEEQTAGEATRELRININGSEVATVSVTLTSSDTNKTVLEKIRDAINNSTAASSAMTAAVVSDTSSTSRLTFVSKSTGSVGAISIEDVSGTLLDTIGLTDDIVTNRTASTSTTGGFVYGAATELDARYTFNGIDFTSSSNTVENVLPGITLQLKAAQAPSDAPLQLTVTADTAAVQSNIQNFLTAYNSVITYIKQQTAVNPQANTREIFAGDTVVTRLRVDLQALVTSTVTGVSTDYNALFKIGITAGSDGTLTVSNSTTLSNALKNNSTEVMNLFGLSGDGVAAKIQNALSSFVGATGEIETTRTIINNQMTSLTNRITAMNKRIDKQVEQYREQFSKMLAAYQEALAQQKSLQSLTDALYSAFYY